MAAIFQIRRGGSSNTSSLASGELYLNTTEGALQVGTPTAGAPIKVLSLNTASFGDIILTGSAYISGNVVLGGTITIGDTTSDSVVFNADLSSSIIPDATNTYDLGASDKKYRNVYATSISGAIAATNGVISGSAQVIGILDSLNTFSGSQLTQNSALATITGSVETRLTEVGVVTGSLISSASVAAIVNSNQNSFTASALTRLSNLETTSASVNTSISSLNTFSSSTIVSLGELQSKSASVDISILNINSTTASLNTSVSNLNITSASVNTSVSNLNSFTESAASRLSQLETASGSAKVSIAELNSYTSSLKAAITASGTDITINGNLTVKGTTTQIDSTTFNIGDNIIELNYGGAVNIAGIYTKDATGASLTSGSLLWDSTNDNWKAGKKDLESKILLAGGDNVFTSSLQLTEINNTTASLNNTTSSLNLFSASVTASLVSIHQTTSSLNLFSASVTASLESVYQTTASLNTYTQSNDGKVNSIINKTGSFATTGSNSFYGNQIISGNIYLTGSIIPSGSASFDLGSQEHPFRHLYIGSGSLFVGGEKIIGDNNVVIPANYDLIFRGSGSVFPYSGQGDLVYQRSDGSERARFWLADDTDRFVVAFNGDHYQFKTVLHTGNLLTFGSSSFIVTSSFNSYTASLNNFSASVTASLESVYQTTASLNNFTGSQLTQNTALATITGSLIVSASQSYISASLMTASVAQLRTDVDYIFGIGGISGGNPLTQLNLFTSSINTTIKSKLDADGVISGSSQVSYVGLSNIPSGIISSSAQIDALFNIDGLVSGSSQITYANISSIPSGIVSGSSQVDADSITNFDSNVKSKLDADAVVSGSLLGLLPAGIVSGSSQITYASISSIPAGIVSGSSQINIYDVENFATFNDAISAEIGEKLFTSSFNSYTASINSFTSSINTTIKSKLDADGVISGSSQIITANSITLGTHTTGNYVATIAGTSNQIVVAGSGLESAAITLSTPQDIHTSAHPQFHCIGLGTAASGVTGEVRATGDITAFYSSDVRLKENIQPIQNALEKVESISGNTYDWKEGYDEVHSHKGNDVGVIAQEIEQILPQIVTNRDNGYKAVQYEKIIPLLIQAIKELSNKVKVLENK